MSKETRDDRPGTGLKPPGAGGNSDREQFVRWMSGSGERPSPGDADRSVMSAFLRPDKPAPGGACEFVLAALTEYAEPSEQTAKSRMPHVAEHLQSCLACQEALALLREALSAHSDWVHLAAAIGAVEPGSFVVAIGHAWHWLGGGQQIPVRLRQEDFALRRGLGDWMLLPQRTEVLSLARGQGLPSPLALTREFTRGARLNVTITPESLSSSHRQMWRLDFELAAGSSVERVQLDLTHETRQSLGTRTLRPGKTVEYQVDPPARGSYSVTIEWCDAAGRENESVLMLPVRAAGMRDDG